MSSFTTIFGAVILAFGIAGFLVNQQPQVELLYKGQDLYTLAHMLLGIVLIVVGLFVSKKAVPTQMDRGRTLRFWGGSATYILVFVALLVGVNFLVARYDKRIDLTEQGVYSLAEQSLNAVKGLQKPLKIIGFDVQTERQVDNLRDLLALYRNANPNKVSTEFVSPRSRPELVERLGMKGGNLIYIEYGESNDQGAGGTTIARLNEATEESITNGILKLTGGDAKKVYYLTGHKEPGIADAAPTGLQRFADALKDEHIELAELSLAQSKTGGVPADASSVIWLNPEGPLLPGELNALQKYLDEGGRLMVSTEARSTGIEDVRLLASHAGITIGNDLVLDVVTQLFAGPSVALQFAAFNFGSHEITKRFGQRDVVIVDGAVSVKGGATQGDVTYSDLLKTSENGWAESNLAAIFSATEPSAEFGEGDTKGPIGLGVAYEKKIDDKRSARLIVFGDSSWMTNGSFKYPAHRDLALNSIAWLNGQAANISIRPRTMRSSITPISATTFRNLLQVGFIVPELIVLFGLFVWWRRRTLGARS